MTPKHIGLGLTLHQATRSEKLVDLFHAAGHTIGMDTIRRIDTTIASDIIDRFNKNGHIYIPNELVPYSPSRIVLASCDNIDVLEETIDGKNTFHCTQMMLWQRGPANIRSDIDIKHINRAKTITRDSLDQFHKLDHASMPVGERPKPVSNLPPDLEIEKWFNESNNQVESKMKNMAWIIARMCQTSQQMVPAWADFNEKISLVNSPITTPGMLPILQAPADDNNTMTTILNRFTSIAKHLGQPNTVIAVDQPLYSRGKEIIWANPEKYQNVVLVMGHLHVLFNFLKAIGQHMENSGLADIWVESGVFAQNTTGAMLEGKQYYRAVRGHLLTYEALSRIYWQYFTSWLTSNEREVNLKSMIDQIVKEFSHRDSDDGAVKAVNCLVTTLKTHDVLGMMDEFDNTLQHLPNFVLWRSYMKMVETLLDFIRANREVNWALHLDSFSAMLPWMTIYDHTNYARWGAVYLCEMKNLQNTHTLVYEEFLNGNFVVKRSQLKFNQIPLDQATEWQNKICKISNGIIGITRNDTARDKFCITWAERSYHVSHSTRVLFGVDDDANDTISTRKDAQPGRVSVDESAVSGLKELFLRFNVFKINTFDPLDGYVALEEIAENVENEGERMEVDMHQLTSLATNDVATDDIQHDMLTAQQRGQQMVLENIGKYLVRKDMPFFDPIKKNKSKTFATLYASSISIQNEKKVIKADRKLLQRLLTVSLAGRNIDMHDILKHELSNVPLPLANVNGTLNSTTNSDLVNILMDGETIPHTIPAPTMHQNTCVLIDGHALVQALGKPQTCRTFDDYARVFFRAVTAHVDEHVRRVDVVFDTYVKQSIALSTVAKNRFSKRRPPTRLRQTN